MNRYHLKILYLTSNKYRTPQYYETVITASHFEIKDNNIYFFQVSPDNLEFEFNHQVKSVYPTRNTIIERVEYKIKEEI